MPARVRGRGRGRGVAAAAAAAADEDPPAPALAQAAPAQLAATQAAPTTPTAPAPTPTQPAQAQQGGETIDLSGVGDDAETAAADMVTNTGTNVGATATGIHRTADIHHFFKTVDTGNGNLFDFCTHCLASPHYVECDLCGERDRSTRGESYNGKKVNFKYANSTSTSSKRVHLVKHHPEAIGHGIREGVWMMTNAYQGSGNVTQATEDRVEPYTQAAFRGALIRFIAACDQSIIVVQRPEFRALLRLLRPSLQVKDIPGRTHMRHLIAQEWAAHHATLTARLSSALGKVSLTLDGWTDNMMRPFLAITAHYLARAGVLDPTIELKTEVIAYHYLPVSHTGENMAVAVKAMLDRVGITRQVGWLTMDNASNNDTLMTHLAVILNRRNISFDAKENRIRCFAHILNLGVQAILKHIGAPADELEIVAAFTGTPLGTVQVEAQTLSEAIERQPLNIGRAFFRMLKRKSAVLDSLWRVVDEHNLTLGSTITEGDKMKKLKPVLDSRTRWDSTYLLVERLLHYEPVLTDFFDKAENAEWASYRLTPLEWKVLKDIKAILGPAHKMTHTLTSSATPTLCRTLPTFELLLTYWEAARERLPHFAPCLTEGIDLLTRYYARSDDSTAYAFSMMLNPAAKDSYIRSNWEEDVYEQFRADFFTKMSEYRARIQAENPAPAPAGEPASVSLSSAFGPEFEDMARMASELGVDLAARFTAPAPTTSNIPHAATNQAEWDFYCQQRLFTGDAESDSSPTLKFWNHHRTDLPVLYAMAMDYLPIQSTSVPCEQLFSSGVDTMTKKRNRIAPELMEMLQMLKFTYRQQRINFTSHHKVIEVEAETAPTQDIQTRENDALTVYASAAERALAAGGTLTIAVTHLASNVGSVDMELEEAELARAGVTPNYGF